MTGGREYKRAVYEQFALIGKALCSGPRLEILDVLEQAERTVDVLAAAVGMSVANTSHHLQVLKRGRIVESERRGQHVIYRLAGPVVGEALRAVRVLGARRLSEIERVTTEFLAGREGMEVVDQQALLERIGSGDCIVLDVRPPEEYDAAHVAGALSMPLEELERRLGELPRDRQIVAYCRGPYCVLAVNAVETLRRHGFDAVRAPESVADWRELGLAVIDND
ncbi:MAG: metalloregulator ArsR/SmtB family transcription factor [Thermoleophilia bacterium]